MLNDPRNDLASGVRELATTTASLMVWLLCVRRSAASGRLRARRSGHSPRLETISGAAGATRRPAPGPGWHHREYTRDVGPDKQAVPATAHARRAPAGRS